MWRLWEGRRPTGIDRVCLAYIRHFGKDAQAVVQHDRVRRILDKQASEALFALLAEPPASFRSGLFKAVLKHGLRSGCPARSRLYLNIGHTGLDQTGFRAWLNESEVRPVYLVHDLIPITHPEFCRPGESERHTARMRTVLTTATGIIANSQQTLDEIAGCALEEQVPCPPSLAAWLGTTPIRRPTDSARDSERPTFIIVGTIEGRKNHLMLLHVWARLVKQLGERAPRLLVIGQRGWECEQVIDVLDRSKALKGFVVELGHCDDHALAEHFRNARALLFPSLVEGFGLPLVEALGAGTPVIASDLPVFREIGGNVPDFIDPLDGPGWERAILDYADEGSLARQRQLGRLAGYKPPSWDDHFAAVESWLGQF